MAIQLDYVKNDPNFSGSMTAFNAYWKIEKIQGTKLNINFDISILPLKVAIVEEGDYLEKVAQCLTNSTVKDPDYLSWMR